MYVRVRRKSMDDPPSLPTDPQTPTMEPREELQEVLCSYTTETLTYIDTARGFYESISTWMDARNREVINMRDIKDRADEIDRNISKTMWDYMKSMVTLKSASSRRAELEEELAAVLKVTLGGLEELDRFLDAVEKLAVTSLHVFLEEKQVLHLPEGISLEEVQAVITAARLICPLLLGFKRDASVFFTPRLQNVDVLIYQLDKYIQTTQIICDLLEKSDFPVTEAELGADLCEDDVQRMLCHTNQLVELRMDPHFRMVFLFREVSCSGFISEFDKRQGRIQNFLQDLEETAVQLDRMNKGAKISSVVGSSVGAVGGVLSIVGLALIPVTAGVSLGLTMTGVALGVTSGVSSAITAATEIGVNRTQQKKANEVFQSFIEDVQSLQDCLEEVSHQTVTKALVDTTSLVKLLKSAELITSAHKKAAQEGEALRTRVASDLPDIGQAAVKGPLALSKLARAGFIGINALVIGTDVFLICKDSISLSKGSGTEISQFIRARAALWSSEMDSWKKIHDSLCEGLETSEKNLAVLDKPFYPRREIKTTIDTDDKK